MTGKAQNEKPADGKTPDLEFLVEGESSRQRQEQSDIENRSIRLYPIQGAIGILFSVVLAIGFPWMILASPVRESEPVTSIIAVVIVIAFALIILNRAPGNQLPQATPGPGSIIWRGRSWSL